ncbi:MAG TPA: ABC transporter substrate-binding protein [Alphaproteobacteria bacterium]|nr:ABC transporter substrate-binding protein [Alphaproteobacteria bacterium]
MIRTILLAGLGGVVLMAGALGARAFETVQPYASSGVSFDSVADGAAKPGQGAQAFVADMGDRAISFLSDSSLSQEAKRLSFRKLLDSSFDMETIGRFALGRYWRTTSPKQRQTYLSLFRNMVVDVYSARFEDYKGQSFEVKSARAEGVADFLVTSFIVPKGDTPVQVDWRVRNKGGRYRIVDVIVEGVSMATTQRQDFAAVIGKGGGDVQVLIDHLSGRGK